MKHYTIKINKNNNNNTSFNFRDFTDPSKKLDDFLASRIIESTPYLYDIIAPKKTYKTRILIPNRDYSSLLKDNFDIEFGKAARFLLAYTRKPKLDFSIYSMDDNINFFEDEIQIGSTLIPLYMLEDSRYYSSIPKKTKNIIINIFISINR